MTMCFWPFIWFTLIVYFLNCKKREQKLKNNHFPVQSDGDNSCWRTKYFDEQNDLKDRHDTAYRRNMVRFIGAFYEMLWNVRIIPVHSILPVSSPKMNKFSTFNSNIFPFTIK